jgi:hypothetical protein
MPSNTHQSGGYSVGTGSGGNYLIAKGKISTGGTSTSQNATTQTVPFSQLATVKSNGGDLAFVTTIRALTVKAQTNAFNKLFANQYVIPGFSTKLAGVTNSVLRSPATNASKGGTNYYVAYFRTQRIVLTGGWNYVTGKPINMVEAIDTFTAETFPTRAIPGRILFLKNGSKSVTAGNYQAKTG